MPDTEKVNKIREAMPVVTNRVYLNTGSIGPFSTITRQVLQEANDLELAEGRATISGGAIHKKAAAELRAAFARLVKAQANQIALTRHTTDGMNIAIHGLNWQPGDEVITTNLEHPGGLLPVYVLRQRYGVVVKVVDIPADCSATEIVAKFEAAITPRTRLMVYSHVAWNTGICLPLTEIVAMGHRHHVLSAVDGAQSAGAIPLDLPASGADFYAMPGQKWLCGPEAVGAFYIRQDRLSMLEPTFVGYRSMGDQAVFDYSGYYMPSPDARRYENGTVYKPGIKAMVANMVWLDKTAGWPWIYAHIAHIAAYAQQKLKRMAGVTMITPSEPQAGLITFTLDGYNPAQVVAKLAKDDIVIRSIGSPPALRISTGFYNTTSDINRLIEALQAIVAPG